MLVKKLISPPLKSALPQEILKTPYLNRFRREPAISKFDWPFTPNHKSSQYFATHTGSALNACSWLDHLVSGHI